MDGISVDQQMHHSYCVESSSHMDNCLNELHDQFVEMQLDYGYEYGKDQQDY